MGIIRSSMYLVVLLASFSSLGNEMWRGLVVKEEHRCSPYDKKSQYGGLRPFQRKVQSSPVGLYAIGDSNVSSETVVGWKTQPPNLQRSGW